MRVYRYKLRLPTSTQLSFSYLTWNLDVPLFAIRNPPEVKIPEPDLFINQIPPLHKHKHRQLNLNMALHGTERKRLLYADLFKGYNRGKREIQSWSSSHLASDWDDSSSGFSTPFGSEIGSSEGEDGDFIAELTKQMAEGMLRDEEEAASAESVSEEAQVHELKNQPPTTKQVPNNTHGGRRTRATELAHQNYRGKEWRSGLGDKGQAGSRMRAIFLRNGSSGTGVYLPRVANDLVELKKKPGCSTVLIPTRVLEILELHYSNRHSSDSSGPSLMATPLHVTDEWSQSWVQQPGTGRNIEPQIDVSSKDVEMHLPKEWTY